MNNQPNYQSQLLQVEEIKPAEGLSLPETTQPTQPDNNITQIIAKCNDKLQEKIKIAEKAYKNSLNVILRNGKKPLWLGMTASTYQADLELIIQELKKNPSLEFGVVTGEQLKGKFGFVAIDVDIDTEDCKKSIAEQIESRAEKHGVHFYKEITKSGRIHYYALLDEITEEIEKISKLPYPFECFKFKNGKAIHGEIEFFAKKNKYIAIYDENPFIADDILVFTPRVAFLDFINEWMEDFAEDTIEDKEPVKEKATIEDKEPIASNNKQDFNGDYNDEESTFTISDITREQFYAAISRCGVLKMLDEDWENHSYEEWFLMTTLYAIKILYAKNEEEKEKLVQEYHEKSSRYSNYKEKEADYMLNKIISYQKEGLKIHGCKRINEVINPKYLQACKSCRYKMVDREGNIYGHYLFSYLNKYKENLEDDDVTIPGWALKDNGWNMYINQTGTYVQVLPWFRIRSHYIVGNQEDEFIELVDSRGRSYIKKVERRSDSYKPSLDIIKSFGKINPSRISEGKAFLAEYIENVKAERGVKIDFVGYRFIGNEWDIIVGGSKYSRKEISFIFGKEMEGPDWYIPEVKGSEKLFKLTYQALFNLNDPPLHLALAHFLSHIGREYIKDRSLIGYLNPVFIVVGDTGTGKSLRLKIATALYGSPSLFSFTNITQASFNNNFPLLKVPFGVDEVIMKTAADERKFGELIYNITNIQGKMTYNNTYNPIDVPVSLCGETENLLIDKAFSNFRGLNRRSIVIEMTESFKDNSNVLDDALNKLQFNHGHILSYVRSLKEDDKIEIEDLIKNIEAKLNFGNSSFNDLRKHLAVSLAMFHHFFLRFIGISKDEMEKKINSMIEFATAQIHKKQVVKVGETVDYMEEIINFIAKVEEALNNKKSLKNLSYEKLCNTIGFTPSNRVGQLLKKFFWKKYTYESRTSTLFRFRPGVLIINPIEFEPDNGRDAIMNQDIIQEDRERLNDLTDEELKVWVDIFKLRYDSEKKRKIVDALGNQRLRKMIPD